MENIEKAKFLAAKKAIAEIKEEEILGLGSGSTMIYFVRELGRIVKERGWKIFVVPSSYQIHLEAIKSGLKILDTYNLKEVDITIDGADEIDRELNLIKGGGGALTREKILAMMSKKYLIIADYRKLVEKIGKKHPIPVEILPFCWRYTTEKLRKYGEVKLRTLKNKKIGPVITDNGNFIVDIYLSNKEIIEVKNVEEEIKKISGVIEVGIFTKIVDKAFIGYSDKVIELKNEKM